MNPDNTHILIVEDEEKIARLLADYLEREGYRVSLLHTGDSAVETVRSLQPDFLVLDLMLPGKDGLAICREVRQFSQIPIMMLTAKVDEIDRLIGLELGADDYVCKPFSPREVVARVKVILRRTAASAEPAESADDEISYRGISLYPERFQCQVKGRGVELTPIEFRLLRALLSRPGHVLSRDRLMTQSYTDGRIVSDRTIDTHVKNLRRKLSLAGDGEDYLHSIYGVGYKID